LASFTIRLRRAAWCAALLGSGLATAAELPVITSDQDDTWCPPRGPGLPALLAADHSLILKPSWLVLQMRVRPGEAPVSDIRVLSQAGGPSLARVWLPFVRQWTGCVENSRDVIYQAKFTFSYQGNHHLPEKEAFGLWAFLKNNNPPRLAADDWAIGVCPIKATLVLRQPMARNEVREIESDARPVVRQWLEQLVPDRDYMLPSPSGNRVEFDCKVSKGEFEFMEQ
jgi:hypothetical protein